jgi:hypothetical protein
VPSRRIGCRRMPARTPRSRSRPTPGQGPPARPPRPRPGGAVPTAGCGSARCRRTPPRSSRARPLARPPALAAAPAMSPDPASPPSRPVRKTRTAHSRDPAPRPAARALHPGHQRVHVRTLAGSASVLKRGPGHCPPAFRPHRKHLTRPASSAKRNGELNRRLELPVGHLRTVGTRRVRRVADAGPADGQHRGRCARDSASAGWAMAADRGAWRPSDIRSGPYRRRYRHRRNLAAAVRLSGGCRWITKPWWPI